MVELGLVLRFFILVFFSLYFWLSFVDKIDEFKISLFFYIVCFFNVFFVEECVCFYNFFIYFMIYN